MAEEERKELTGTFSLVRVQGTGTKAQYTKIADDLVRKSRIFWRLCEKIHEAKRISGLHSRFREHHKKKYNELMSEFKKFEADCQRIFIQQEKKLVRKDQIIARRNLTIKRHILKFKKWAGNRRDVARTSKKLRDREANVENAERFFVKRIRWHRQHPMMEEKAEIHLRSIFGFHDLLETKQTTLLEFMYLCVGMQVAGFGKDDLTFRFGEERFLYFKRDIKNLISKGYFRRFDRKELYYITSEGKKKFMELNKYIIGRQHKAYWENIFTKHEE